MLSWMSGGRKQESEDSCRASSLCGYLWKMKRNHEKRVLIPQWNKRWFSIEGRLLKWYATATSEESSGMIDLRFITCVSSFEAQGVFSFILSYPDRNLLLRASNLSDTQKWIRALQFQADIVRGGCGMTIVTECNTSGSSPQGKGRAVKEKYRPPTLEANLEAAMVRLQILENSVLKQSSSDTAASRRTSDAVTSRRPSTFGSDKREIGENGYERRERDNNVNNGYEKRDKEDNHDLRPEDVRLFDSTNNRERGDSGNNSINNSISGSNRGGGGGGGVLWRESSKKDFRIGSDRSDRTDRGRDNYDNKDRQEYNDRREYDEKVFSKRGVDTEEEDLVDNNYIQRENRENREPRENRETRETRENRETRDVRDGRENGRDNATSRENARENAGEKHSQSQSWASTSSSRRPSDDGHCPFPERDNRGARMPSGDGGNNNNGGNNPSRGSSHGGSNTGSHNGSHTGSIVGSMMGSHNGSHAGSYRGFTGSDMDRSRGGELDRSRGGELDRSGRGELDRPGRGESNDRDLRKLSADSIEEIIPMVRKNSRARTQVTRQRDDRDESQGRLSREGSQSRDGREGRERRERDDNRNMSRDEDRKRERRDLGRDSRESSHDRGSREDRGSNDRGKSSSIQKGSSHSMHSNSDKTYNERRNDWGYEREIYGGSRDESFEGGLSRKQSQALQIAAGRHGGLRSEGSSRSSQLDNEGGDYDDLPEMDLIVRNPSQRARERKAERESTRNNLSPSSIGNSNSSGWV